MIPKFNAEIQASMAEGTRPDPRTRSLWMECQKRKMIIEAACGNGTMTPEEYVEVQKKQVEKDNKLAQYFLQTKDAKKLAIVKERLSIIQTELSQMWSNLQKFNKK